MCCGLTVGLLSGGFIHQAAAMLPGGNEFAVSTSARSSCDIGLNVVGVNSAMIK